MKLMKNFAGIWTLALLALPLATGCGGGGAESAAPEDGATGSAPADGQAITQPASGAAQVVADGVGTEPAQSVAVFLDSLRRGDETAANSVLTSKAQQELAKTAYVIQPLGTPEGKYEIGRVGYPYEEKTVALVECLWTEPAAGDQPEVTMDIVCEVHLESEGWRISGIGVTIPGTEEALVLDFEDADGLQQTIDAATGQTTATGQSSGQQVAGQQLAEQPAGGLRPVGLPAYPEQLGGGTGQQTAAPQQIALPPLPDAPIQR